LIALPALLMPPRCTRGPLESSHETAPL
jgi:hypothetical protein